MAAFVEIRQFCRKNFYGPAAGFIGICIDIGVIYFIK